MRRLLLATLPLVLHAPALRSQTSPLTYRGFALAAPYADFTTQARLLANPGTTPVLCNTSKRTAQLMECAVPILDPSDSADFYLAAYVMEGQVAFLSFGDSGSVPLVAQLQRDLKSRFGEPHASRAGMWEWRSGREVIRLSWRGRGSTRWTYVAMWDEPLMNRISRYVPRRKP